MAGRRTRVARAFDTGSTSSGSDGASTTGWIAHFGADGRLGRATAPNGRISANEFREKRVRAPILRGSSREGAANVLQEQNQVKLVGGARLELGNEVNVERAGFVVLGVDE
jgi:hypothetical protein